MIDAPALPTSSHPALRRAAAAEGACCTAFWACLQRWALARVKSYQAGTSERIRLERTEQRLQWVLGSVAAAYFACFVLDARASYFLSAAVMLLCLAGCAAAAWVSFSPSDRDRSLLVFFVLAPALFLVTLCNYCVLASSFFFDDYWVRQRDAEDKQSSFDLTYNRFGAFARFKEEQARPH